MPVCERCGKVARLYKNHKENGEEWWLCWDCDWEMMNNWASEDEESWEIHQRRAEEDYEYDPLYYPCPY